MNKILSQALKKAVSEYSPEVKEVQKSNRPDLFSLNNETELFQNDKGIIIKLIIDLKSELWKWADRDSCGLGMHRILTILALFNASVSLAISFLSFSLSLSRLSILLLRRLISAS